MDVVQRHLRQQAIAAGMRTTHELVLADVDAALSRGDAATPPPVLDLDLVGPFREALAGSSVHGRLELQHMPHVDLRDGSVLGLEALVRWSDPARGTVWPAALLQVARAAELMPQLGEWVVGAVVEQAAQWSGTVPVRTRHWLNIDAAQLEEWGFVDRLLETLRRAGLTGASLGIHLPAGDVVTPTARLGGAVDALRGAGIAVGVEGVGRLRPTTLPVDALVLLPELVLGLVQPGADGEEAVRRVEGVVTFAASAGAAVVGAGIQTRAESDRLLSLGVSVGFGYLFAGPQRADRASWTLSRSRNGAWRGTFVGDGQTSPMAITGDGPDLHGALPVPV